MKVRLLSPYGVNLEKTILKNKDHVFYALDETLCDIAVMYGHRDILSEDDIAQYRLGVVNIHPSLLPFGRGAHPNFWAWFYGEPHGVTIHTVIDRGIDTGPILASSNVEFAMPERETLNSSYMTLHEAAEALFERMWPVIRLGEANAVPQISTNQARRKRDLEPYWPLLSKGWDTPVNEVVELGKKHGSAGGTLEKLGS